MREERRSSRLWEQKSPAKLWDRGGFLHPEYPSNGLVFPFLFRACEYSAAHKQERKGKHERGQFTSSEEYEMLPETSQWGFFAKAKGQLQAGHAKQAAWESSYPWPGHFGRVQQRQAWKEDGFNDPSEISPCRKGRTSPRRHQISAPYTQPGPGGSLSPRLLSDSIRRGQLAFFHARHFGEG